MLADRIVLGSKLVGYVWSAITLAITWISNWALIAEGKDTIFGYPIFNVKDSIALAWLLFPGAVILSACYVAETRFGIGHTKKAALKQYVRKLGPLLAKRYGKSKYYSQGQVKNTISKYRLNYNYIAYAFAVYLGEQEFQAISQEYGIDSSYLELRGEIALCVNLPMDSPRMQDHRTKGGQV